MTFPPLSAADASLERSAPSPKETPLTLMTRALLLWVVIAAAMFANGALRVLVLQPRLGEGLAREVATGLGVAIVFGFAFLFVRGVEEPASGDLLLVGTLWLVLTLAFEFGLGYVTGASWQEMLADYDILSGRLWPLIPLSALVAPWFWGALGMGRAPGGP
jgi:hypothetical protein